jgi:hypothetical protein
LSSKNIIKLNLSGLVSKIGLGDILSGLKGNIHVKELNLNNCELDEEDLSKISEALKAE